MTDDGRFYHESIHSNLMPCCRKDLPLVADQLNLAQERRDKLEEDRQKKALYFLEESHLKLEEASRRKERLREEARQEKAAKEAAKREAALERKRLLEEQRKRSREEDLSRKKSKTSSDTNGFSGNLAIKKKSSAAPSGHQTDLAVKNTRHSVPALSARSPQIGNHQQAQRSSSASRKPPLDRISPARKPPLDRKSPARKPSDSPARKPSDSPARKPSDSPARKPSDSPARKPSDSPARKPSDSPARKPSDSPARKPSDSPARKPSDSPARKPSDSPARKPPLDRISPVRKPPLDSPARKPPLDSPARKPSDSPARKPSEGKDSPARKPSEGKDIPSTTLLLPSMVTSKNLEELSENDYKKEIEINQIAAITTSPNSDPPEDTPTPMLPSTESVSHQVLEDTPTPIVSTPPTEPTNQLAPSEGEATSHLEGGDGDDPDPEELDYHRPLLHPVISVECSSPLTSGRPSMEENSENFSNNFPTSSLMPTSDAPSRTITGSYSASMLTPAYKKDSFVHPRRHSDDPVRSRRRGTAEAPLTELPGGLRFSDGFSTHTQGVPLIIPKDHWLLTLKSKTNDVEEEEEVSGGSSQEETVEEDMMTKRVRRRELVDQIMEDTRTELKEIQRKESSKKEDTRPSALHRQRYHSTSAIICQNEEVDESNSTEKGEKEDTEKARKLSAPAQMDKSEFVCKKERESYDQPLDQLPSFSSLEKTSSDDNLQESLYSALQQPNASGNHGDTDLFGIRMSDAVNGVCNLRSDEVDSQSDTSQSDVEQPTLQDNANQSDDDVIESDDDLLPYSTIGLLEKDDVIESDSDDDNDVTNAHNTNVINGDVVDPTLVSFPADIISSDSDDSEADSTHSRDLYTNKTRSPKSASEPAFAFRSSPPRSSLKSILKKGSSFSFDEELPSRTSSVSKQSKVVFLDEIDTLSTESGPERDQGNTLGPSDQGNTLGPSDTGQTTQDSSSYLEYFKDTISSDDDTDEDEDEESVQDISSSGGHWSSKIDTLELPPGVIQNSILESDTSEEERETCDAIFPSYQEDVDHQIGPSFDFKSNYSNGTEIQSEDVVADDTSSDDSASGDSVDIIPVSL